VSDQPITLEDVKRLRLEPGDTLVLRLGHFLPADVVAHLQAQMKAAFPNHRTVVLADDMELEVVSGESS
jgi:hypothetical protein